MICQSRIQSIVITWHLFLELIIDLFWRVICYVVLMAVLGHMTGVMCFRSECHAEEGGRGGSLQTPCGDQAEWGTVLHQDLHDRTHHRDQLPDWPRVQWGDGGWLKVSGNGWYREEMTYRLQETNDLHGCVSIVKVASVPWVHLLSFIHTNITELNRRKKFYLPFHLSHSCATLHKWNVPYGFTSIV